MKIAITGAAGHIGNNLSRRLSEQGHELRLMVHQQRRGLENIPADFFQADLMNPKQVDAFVENQEIVIHTAARIAIENDPTGAVYRTNVEGTRHIIQACVQHRVRRLLFLSSIHAFDPHPLHETLDETRPLRLQGGSQYDQSKVQSELLVLEAARSGLDAVILSPTSVYGPYDFYPSLLGQAMIDIYRRRIPALINGGYDFVYVEDVVQGIIAAMEKGRASERYLLSGSYVHLKQLSTLIGNWGKIRTPKLIVPTGLLKACIPFFQLQSRLQKKPALITRMSLNTLLESPRKVDSSKAMQELGYQKTPFEEGLAQTLRWFSEQGKW